MSVNHPKVDTEERRPPTLGKTGSSCLDREQKIARINRTDSAERVKEQGNEHFMDNPHWFIAGVLAKLIIPGPNEPSGFILTTILGIVGAFVATYLGQALGWYKAGAGAGLIGATVGAVIVLLVWGAIAAKRA